MQVSVHWSVPQEIGVTQEMHHEHCREAPLCKSALELILLCITRVTEDDQSHTKHLEQTTTIISLFHVSISYCSLF